MSIEEVSVSITVSDAPVNQAGFGIPMILPEDSHSVFSERTKEYAGITEVAADWATSTLVYKAANAAFGQTSKGGKSLEKLKIGRVDAADANVTATLNAIIDEDNSWYCLLTTDRAKANILLMAAWVETQDKIFIVASEDADIITSATDDLASSLESASYSRTALIYTHEAGLEMEGLTLAVSSGVVTVTDTAHGGRVGDTVLIAGATDSGSDANVLNGDVSIASVPTADTWTYACSGAADGAASGTITGHARYKFPDAAWAGKCLPENPGKITWKYQTLSGIVAIPTTLMGSAARAYAEGKNANVYITANGNYRTTEGIMMTGRFIDNQRSIDWLDRRMEEFIDADLQQLKKVPYTNAGLAVIDKAMRAVFALALEEGVLNPLSDADDDVDLDFILTIPKISEIASASRAARLFPDITFRALIGSAVHGVTVAGTLEV